MIYFNTCNLMYTTDRNGREQVCGSSGRVVIQVINIFFNLTNNNKNQ